MSWRPGVESAVPNANGAACSAWRVATSASNARMRSSSFTSELARPSERAELHDVAAEEERHRPIDDDAQLPGDERQLVEVVGARDEPPGEAAQRDPEHVRDALVAAERRHLPEHAVAVRAHVACEVLREAAGLAQRVLARRRVRRPRRREVRDARAVAERPDVLAPLDPERLVDQHAPAL